MTEEQTATQVRELFEAGVHFGHQTQKWNPKMKPYIFSARNGIYIIDLRKTSDKLDEACAAAREFASRGKNIVFVGTKMNLTVKSAKGVYLWNCYSPFVKKPKSLTRR